jgi:hypothetical protein
MEKSNGSPRSHLFTIRIWEEEIEADSTELRGKVQMFPSGEVRYFREWVALVPLVRAMLAELKSEADM